MSTDALPSLSELVGQNLVARISIVDERVPTLIKLLRVETGGIWLESQKATEHWLTELKVSATPKTLVFFVPYSQIAWILSSADYPALSEKALGV